MPSFKHFNRKVSTCFLRQINFFMPICKEKLNKPISSKFIFQFDVAYSFSVIPNHPIFLTSNDAYFLLMINEITMKTVVQRKFYLINQFFVVLKRMILLLVFLLHFPTRSKQKVQKYKTYTENTKNL